jgi:hypothetical protein
MVDDAIDPDEMTAGWMWTPQPAWRMRSPSCKALANQPRQLSFHGDCAWGRRRTSRVTTRA